MGAVAPALESSRRRLPGPLLAALIGLGILLGAALFTSWRDGERAALSKLEPEARARLYQQTLAAFESLCGGAALKPELEARCGEQAQFLQRFPECDEACRKSTSPFLPQPTR